MLRVARTGGAPLVLITPYGAANSVFGFVAEAARLIGQEREQPQPPM